MNHDPKTPRAILELIASDTTGLLGGETSSRANPVDRPVIEAHLQEIVDFQAEHGHAPRETSDSLFEFQLATRLKRARADAELGVILAKLDTNSALDSELQSREAPQDQVGAIVDTFGLLSGGKSNAIFDLKHVAPSVRLNPRYMSNRVRCLTFFRYEALFHSVHAEIANKTRELAEFRSEHLTEGAFFVLAGVLGYLAKVDLSAGKHEYRSGARSREDGRTLCIFENGTESQMLYRSLVKALQVDGFLLPLNRINSAPDMTAEEGDQARGFVYVLTTLHPKLVGSKDLYKIGFTSGLVSERIANCEREATYLFSRVRVSATYRCYNINAATVEDQLHKAFEATRADVELRDPQGRVFRPREWFQVRIEDIERAIELVQANKLADYVHVANHGFVQRSTG
jgi:hypothetical protein